MQRRRDALPEEGSASPAVTQPRRVVRLIDAAAIPLHRILLMTLYATGVRRVEVAGARLLQVAVSEAPKITTGSRHCLLRGASDTALRLLRSVVLGVNCLYFFATGLFMNWRDALGG